MQEDIKNRIDELEKTLKYHAKKYYEENTNEISDYEYDKLNNELKQLYKLYPQFLSSDSITQQIGGQIAKGFSKVEHKIPMQSLQDVFNFEEVKEFYDRIEKEAKINNIEDLKFVVETKIDGLSASLVYDNGKYIQGSTRGNGLVGEDVTKNIKTIEHVPKEIEHTGYIELRGEVFFNTSDFEKLNQIREEQGEELFANARNAAARTLRQLDVDQVKNRPLDIFIFNVQEDKQNLFNSHYDYLNYLEKQGFNIIPYRYLCSNYEQIIDAIEKIHKLRENLGFGIDGAVIKVDNLRFRKILGVNAKTPKWAIAYKYPPEEKPTKVLDIIFTVGKTGAIIPNAILEPVKVDGSVISKVTLHNEDNLKQKDVRIGDTVYILKAGDVIPKLTHVDKNARTGEERQVEFPKTCPVCGGEVVREEGSAINRCTNPNCEAKLSRQIEYFVSKAGMNIEGLGEGIVNNLLEENKISSIADIFTLTKEDILSYYKDGQKIATNLINSIEKAKSQSLEHLISGLSIKGVGSALAKTLAQKFQTMENLENATYEQLKSISDIGDKVAKEIVEYFQNPQNKELIQKLKDVGVNMSYTRTEVLSTNLENLTFVITGTFEKLKRGEIENLIEENGGKVTNSVSKNTDFLVLGQDAGSKLEKAQKYAVLQISLDTLEQMAQNKDIAQKYLKISNEQKEELAKQKEEEKRQKEEQKRLEQEQKQKEREEKQRQKEQREREKEEARRQREEAKRIREEEKARKAEEKARKAEEKERAKAEKQRQKEERERQKQEKQKQKENKNGKK